MSMNEVAPGVWVGGIECLSRPQALADAGIRFVLSVCQPDGVATAEGVTHHLRVGIDDDAEADILSCFERCIAFIRQAIESESAVLVHCVSGISRSPAVAMAYIMATEGLPCPKAFRQLKRAHRPSCPNEGFRAQLKLFEAMCCKVDPQHPEYRVHLLQHTVSAHLDSLGEIPLAPTPDAAARGGYEMMLQCRKCRFRAATDRNVMSHDPGKGQVAFRWRRRETLPGAAADDGPQCSSLFIEPMKWMEPLVESGQLQGKLCCPRCGSRFGVYNWAGSQCSCGSWVTPSFQIVASRVDCMPPPAAPRLAGARRAAAVLAGGSTAAAAGVAVEREEGAGEPARGADAGADEE